VLLIKLTLTLLARGKLMYPRDGLRWDTGKHATTCEITGDET